MEANVRQEVKSACNIAVDKMANKNMKDCPYTSKSMSFTYAEHLIYKIIRLRVSMKWNFAEIKAIYMNACGIEINTMHKCM